MKMRLKNWMPVVALFYLGLTTTGCELAFGIGTPPVGDGSGVPTVTLPPEITVPPVTTAPPVATVPPTTTVPPNNDGGGLSDWIGDSDGGFLSGLFGR